MNLDKKFESIEFAIKYSLGDYYKIISDHVPNAVEENPKTSSAITGWMICKVVPTISCMVAIANGKLKPTYHFIISSDGTKFLCLEETWLCMIMQYTIKQY